MYMATGDLGSNVDRFLRAAEAFFNNLAAIGWVPFAIALVLWAGMLLARSHAWANALRAAYSRSQIDERFIAASFLAGPGSTRSPARRRRGKGRACEEEHPRRSSYPAVVSSFAVLARSTRRSASPCSATR